MVNVLVVYCSATGLNVTRSCHSDWECLLIVLHLEPWGFPWVPKCIPFMPFAAGDMEATYAGE